MYYSQPNNVFTETVQCESEAEVFLMVNNPLFPRGNTDCSNLIEDTDNNLIINIGLAVGGGNNEITFKHLTLVFKDDKHFPRLYSYFNFYGQFF